jgi:hypothetical protein
VVGVERFGDVDVELRFFPYRGAIRKARRGEKIFPAFPIGLVLTLNFQRALEHYWLSRFLEGTQARLEPSLQGFSKCSNQLWDSQIHHSLTAGSRASTSAQCAAPSMQTPPSRRHGKHQHAPRTRFQERDAFLGVKNQYYTSIRLHHMISRSVERSSSAA